MASEWLYGRQAVREALHGRAANPPAACWQRAPGCRPRLPKATASEGARRPPPPARCRAGRVGRTGNGARASRSSGSTRQQLDELTNRANHQGVAAQAAPYRYTGLGRFAGAACRRRDRQRSSCCWIACKTPRTSAPCLRTAEAAGVTGIVLPEHRAVGVTPAVVNASAGAVEHLAVAQVTNLARSIEQLQAAGLWVWALDTDPPTTLYTAADLTGPLGLVVGAEGAGVSRLVRARCDGALRLPMHGQVASLNAATAGSVVLYEVLRQRAVPR